MYEGSRDSWWHKLQNRMIPGGHTQSHSYSPDPLLARMYTYTTSCVLVLMYPEYLATTQDKPGSSVLPGGGVVECICRKTKLDPPCFCALRARHNILR
jgi:hypothetical protein